MILYILNMIANRRSVMSRRNAVNRRKEQVLHQRIVIVVLTICIILCGVLLGSEVIDAGQSNASEEDVCFKYYTSIEIEQGDTLWSIATEYMGSEYDSIQDYIEEVKELNQLGPDDIHTGQYLMIPYYSAEFR